MADEYTEMRAEDARALIAVIRDLLEEHVPERAHKAYYCETCAHHIDVDSEDDIHAPDCVDGRAEKLLAQWDKEAESDG